MNINKLGANKGGDQNNSRKDNNRQSAVPIPEKKKVIDFHEVSEEQYYDVVKERDLLADEIIFTRSQTQYTSHCYDLLEKYEKYAEDFQGSLQNSYDATLKANSIIQDSIFNEIDVASK